MVNLKLSPIREEIGGKKVAVVDDSIVRGTTSKRLVALLRERGAAEVHMLITCPPVLYPCYYGIDTAERDKLIAANNSIEEIRQYISASKGSTKQWAVRMCTAQPASTAIISAAIRIGKSEHRRNTCGKENHYL